METVKEYIRETCKVYSCEPNDIMVEMALDDAPDAVEKELQLLGFSRNKDNGVRLAKLLPILGM